MRLEIKYCRMVLGGGEYERGEIIYYLSGLFFEFSVVHDMSLPRQDRPGRNCVIGAGQRGEHVPRPATAPVPLASVHNSF